MPDPDHSEQEQRFVSIGMSANGRLYDFSEAERGKFYKPMGKGYTTHVHQADGTTIINHYTLTEGTVLLEPDVRAVFPDSESVNAALRSLIDLMGHLPKTKPYPRRPASPQEAIRRVFEGRNVVVATGTGSGKTEAFLYPILLHLYEEFSRGELDAGVRALILYPMNALANDQRERLGEICTALNKICWSSTHR